MGCGAVAFWIGHEWLSDGEANGKTRLLNCLQLEASGAAAGCAATRKDGWRLGLALELDPKGRRRKCTPHERLGRVSEGYE